MSPKKVNSTKLSKIERKKIKKEKKKQKRERNRIYQKTYREHKKITDQNNFNTMQSLVESNKKKDAKIQELQNSNRIKDILIAKYEKLLNINNNNNNNNMSDDGDDPF